MTTRESSKSKSSSYSKKIVYNAALAILLIVIAVGSYSAIEMATGESAPFTLVGGTSMQPTIMTGTFVIVGKVPFSQLKVGDVIFFAPQIAQDRQCVHSTESSLAQETTVPCYVIHRIVSISSTANGGEYVTTKGDNNNVSIQYYDTNITSSMYVGKVILQVPYLGYLTESPFNRYVIVLVLVSIAAQLLWELRVYESRRVAALAKVLIPRDAPLINSKPKRE